MDNGIQYENSGFPKSYSTRMGHMRSSTFQNAQIQPPISGISGQPSSCIIGPFVRNPIRYAIVRVGEETIG